MVSSVLFTSVRSLMSAHLNSH